MADGGGWMTEKELWRKIMVDVLQRCEEQKSAAA